MIKQIIPAPENMYAIYADEEDGELIKFHLKITFIALMENGDVEPYLISSDGMAGEATDAPNFIRIEYK